jgi:hypothetical protein
MSKGKLSRYYLPKGSNTYDQQNVGSTFIDFSIIWMWIELERRGATAQESW